jgi:hypothetical protein
LEEIKFENFNILKNNIISVKLAKVLGYFIEILFKSKQKIVGEFRWTIYILAKPSMSTI